MDENAYGFDPSENCQNLSLEQSLYIIGYEKPWLERSAIHLNSDDEDHDLENVEKDKLTRGKNSSISSLISLEDRSSNSFEKCDDKVNTGKTDSDGKTQQNQKNKRKHKNRERSRSPNRYKGDYKNRSTSHKSRKKSKRHKSESRERPKHKHKKRDRSSGSSRRRKGNVNGTSDDNRERTSSDKCTCNRSQRSHRK